MVEFLKRFWFWIILPPEQRLQNREVNKIKTSNRPRRSKKELQEEQQSGQYYFKDTILDQLDGYMTILKSMRKADPQSFEMYKRFGGYIAPKETDLFFEGLGDREGEEEGQNIDAHKMPLATLFAGENAPAFGMIFTSSAHYDNQMAKEKDRKVIMDDGSISFLNDLWWPRAFYFTKYERKYMPWTLQPVFDDGAKVYKLTIYWSQKNRKGKRRSVPQDFGVVIYPDGTAKVLRCLEDRTQIVNRKHKHNDTIQHRKWDFPTTYKDWAKQHNTPVEQYLLFIFKSAVASYEATQLTTIRIRASKGKLAANFGVQMERMPYFFSDREATVNEDGVKKRIFHIVRTHTRNMPDGTTQTVKAHFRGLRKFKWRGYHISVSVPGWHHAWEPFTVGMVDEESMTPKERKQKFVAGEQMADLIVKYDEFGVGGAYPFGRSKPPVSAQAAKEFYRRWKEAKSLEESDNEPKARAKESVEQARTGI